MDRSPDKPVLDYARPLPRERAGGGIWFRLSFDYILISVFILWIIITARHETANIAAGFYMWLSLASLPVHAAAVVLSKEHPLTARLILLVAALVTALVSLMLPTLNS